MRIISGKLGGRQFESPKGFKTHPMSEKARGAMFTMLGDIEGLTVLDGFAGSGALGFEALSRGAERVLAIEIDINAQKIIDKNIRSLGVGIYMHLVKANVSSWSDNNPNEMFDIVIVAPPYKDRQPLVVEKLLRHVVMQGLYILDWPSSEELPNLSGVELLSNKHYANAQLAFYRKLK